MCLLQYRPPTQPSRFQRVCCLCFTCAGVLQGSIDGCTCKAVKMYLQGCQRVFAKPSWVGELARPRIWWVYLQGCLGWAVPTPKPLSTQTTPDPTGPERQNRPYEAHRPLGPTAILPIALGGGGRQATVMLDVLFLAKGAGWARNKDTELPDTNAMSICTGTRITCAACSVTTAQ